MPYSDELLFEADLISYLTLKCGWEKEVLKYPTEEDLIENWSKILFDNNKETDVLNNQPLFAAEVVDADGCGGAEHRGEQRGEHRDNQGVAQRVHDRLAAEQLAVPFEREALPHGGVAVVERHDAHHRDGGV